jgi:hypothetical protein
MGGAFEGIDSLRQTGLAVVAGFAFLDFLPFSKGETFAIGAFAVVASFAFQTGLMGTMRKLRRLRGLSWINGGLQGDFRWTLVPSRCEPDQTRYATKRQDSSVNQPFLHVTPPPFYF